MNRSRSPGLIASMVRMVSLALEVSGLRGRFLGSPWKQMLSQQIRNGNRSTLDLGPILLVFSSVYPNSPKAIATAKTRLKIRRPKGRPGSSPGAGTSQSIHQRSISGEDLDLPALALSWSVDVTA